MRQNNPAKQLKDIQHFMPCPGCKEGYLKLRHHLCVCRMKECVPPCLIYSYAYRSTLFGHLCFESAFGSASRLGLKVRRDMKQQYGAYRNN